MSDYNPRNVLKVLRKNNALPRPVGKRVKDAYELKAKPEPLCFPLMAFVERSRNLPEDFHGLAPSSQSLKAHVRPDGGVFLGLFELPNQEGSGIVVFGDPLMARDEAIGVSIAFRRKLQRILDDQSADLERQER